MDETPLPPSSDQLLSSVRTILLAEMQERVRRLEERLEALQSQANQHDLAQQEQMAALQADLQALNNLGQVLQTDLAALQAEALTDPERITARLTPMMTNLIRRTIHDSPDEMAETLGPVMSEAVRVQIRDSREDMVDALYPIIGSTVQRSLANFARELQRNIDARLRGALGLRGIVRTLGARLRGVSAAELTLRDSMPFKLGQVFVIQQGTGMLVAHFQPEGSAASDSDLVSAMLTAIRSFVQDAFGQADNKELDEIQYGNERIIIQSGHYVYTAVVVEGVEPEGFRSNLRGLVAEMHVRFGNALRDYDGDPLNAPPLDPLVSDWIETLAAPAERQSQALPTQQRWFLAGAGLALAAGIVLVCFYAWFTVRLLPLALAPSPTPSLTFTLTPTASPSATPLPTATLTPLPTATITPSPTPSPTPTLAPTVTPTSNLVEGYLVGNVWTRLEPQLLAERGALLLAKTPVRVLAIYDIWAQVEWISESGVQSGWVPLQWISLLQPIPDSLITPAATP